MEINPVGMISVITNIDEIRDHDASILFNITPRYLTDSCYELGLLLNVKGIWCSKICCEPNLTLEIFDGFISSYLVLNEIE